MKKHYFLLYSAALLLCAAVSLTSCNDIERPAVTDNGTISITFEQVDPELPASADEATRTAYHEKTIWWNTGDQVSFVQYASVGGEMTYKSTYLSVSSDRSTLSATISSFNAPDEATDSYYFSVYPRGSFPAYNSSTGKIRPRLTVPATQAPTATSFDPAADLLISDYVENLTANGEGKYTVKFSYYRQVALGKMQIVNLPSASQITSVVFTAEHDYKSVVLAGGKYYDLTVHDSDADHTSLTSLTLDYSDKDYSGDLTAHFTCYPFELEAGDWFQVIVNTAAGETFTRRVNLSGAQTLTLEKGRATQFTVDMSTATKTDSWITTNEYRSSTNYKTTNKIVFSVKSSQTTIVSGKFKAVTEDVFAGISDISAYLDANGTDVSASTISGLNGGGTYVFSGGGLTGDTWCVGLVKLVLDDSTVGVAIQRIKTDWFTMTAQTRAAGGVSYYYYGANLAASTKTALVMATADLPEGQTFESFYTSTLNPANISSSTLETINGKAGATSTGYYTLKYFKVDKTQGDMVPGTNYTVMVKAVNARGETKFVSVNADAGGSTE